MKRNSAVVIQQKIKLLLLCRKYKKDMEFPISISAGGKVDVLCKHLPSDTSLTTMLADYNGYSSVGYLGISRSKDTGELFMPGQLNLAGRALAYNYGYPSVFNYRRFWLRGSLFSSYECEESFPLSIGNEDEVFRAVISMLNNFLMGVFQNEDDREEYLELALSFFDGCDEMDREEIRCNLEEVLWVAENIYKFYNKEWPLEKLCDAAKEFIEEYFLFSINDERFKEELISVTSSIVPLFVALEQIGREEDIDNTYLSLVKLEKAGRLVDYFKLHTQDERNAKFLSCLGYFNQFCSSGDYELTPIWCRDNEDNLYVYFLSGSDLKETKDFDEMDGDFLCALKEIQFIYEEIFSVIQEIA